MAISIPDDFDIYKEELDPNETFIRDELKLNISNWVKFRHSINVGNNVESLENKSEKISEDIKKTYGDLAKSHYTVVTSLGSAKLSLLYVEENLNKLRLFLVKGLKEFYYHLGCLLDNMARIIYIMNDPNADKKTKSEKNFTLLRHWISWKELPVKLIQEYVSEEKIKKIEEILNIRNMWTHGWQPMMGFDNNNDLFVPLEIRSLKEKFLWSYIEESEFKEKYKNWGSLKEMVNNDFGFILGLQNELFEKLIKDIPTFEKKHSINIIK